jgi:predicted Rdx family selenoprotein
MTFVGFNGGDLTIAFSQTGIPVTQILPDSCREQQEAENELKSNPLEAVGLGNFSLSNSSGSFTGSLDVDFAAWWDKWTEAGFPESAVVTGTADVVQDGVNLGQRDFFLVLRSERSARFSGIKEGKPDEASLTIFVDENEDVSISETTFRGELHHESTALL